MNKYVEYFEIQLLLLLLLLLLLYSIRNPNWTKKNKVYNNNNQYNR